MIPTENERLIIRWATKDRAAIEAIRKRFGIPRYTTVNGLSPVELKPEDREVFEECERRGFFSIIRRKWCKNGAHFVFLIR